MFRRRRKKPPPAEIPGWDDFGTDVPQAEPPETGVERERHRLLQTWRHSEQRVMRTWQAWLAAGAGDDRAERYGAYRRALAEEEEAAIAVQCASRAVSVPACDAASDIAESPPR
jgi:hypothetical protein